MLVPRVVILLSGAGTLARSLVHATQDGSLPAEIVGIGTDNPAAPGLAIADEYGLSSFVLDPRAFPDRAAWDEALADQLAAHDPRWIVSAGFMRILGPHVLARFPAHIVNSHPSLLPSFPGANAVRDALAHGVKVTGCTIHLVDEGVDTGPILAQVPVRIHDGQTQDELHEQIKIAERAELVRVVADLCAQRLTLEGRKATFQ